MLVNTMGIHAPYVSHCSSNCVFATSHIYRDITNYSCLNCDCLLNRLSFMYSPFHLVCIVTQILFIARATRHNGSILLPFPSKKIKIQSKTHTMQPKSERVELRIPEAWSVYHKNIAKRCLFQLSFLVEI